MLFASEGTLKERLEDVDGMFPTNPLVKQVIEFIKIQSDRSFCVPNNVATPNQMTATGDESVQRERSEGPLGIIAGRGPLPCVVAEAAQARGLPLHIRRHSRRGE